MTAEDKTALEQALELFVYAPVGLVLAAQEDLPGLIAKGRQQLTGQVTVARMIGQFAVTQGRMEAERRLKDAAERLSALGVVPGAQPAAREPGASAEAPPAASPSEAPPVETSVTHPVTPAEPKPRPGAVADLAIPGYDALAASHVVQRLAGLTPDELEAVRSYEAANRGRRTILSKVAQLQSDGPGS